MASRMERYQNENVASKRVDRNKELYNKSLSENKYSNVEGVLETDKKNSVDIDKLKETIKKYEEESSSKKQLVKKNVDINIDIIRDYHEQEEESHDIREILNKAKQEKEDEEIDKYRSLKKEEYALLMKIKEKKNKFNKKATDNEIKEELANTMQLSKQEIDALEDGIDIFGELDNPDEQTDKTGKSIEELINEAKRDQKDDDFEPTEEIDESFNTASVKLTEKDYEQTQELTDVITNKKIAVNKKLLYLILILLGGMALLCILYFVV